MEIIQNKPNFVDGTNPARCIVSSLDEILELNWVKRWKDDFDGIPFYRYSESSRFRGEHMLMSEWRNNKQHKWLVIGYMNRSVGLPKLKFSYQLDGLLLNI